MAGIGNRTETKAEVTAALVPTLTLAQLITLWNDTVNASNLFRKDIIASSTPVGTAVTIDFAAVDTRTVTITVGTTVTFAGLENGDVKYLIISKAATNSVAFAGATNVSLNQNYVNTVATLVPYEVIDKNGAIYVRALIAGAIDVGTTGTASAWTTARTITLSGNVSGTSPAWSGSGNLAFSGTVVANDSHTHNDTTIDGLNASATTAGTFVDARIPNLDAGKITSGTFASARLPAATTTAIGAIEKATQTETLAGTTGKFIDAELLQGHGAWQTITYVNNHADYTTGDFSGLRYRKLTNGMLQISGTVIRNSGIINTIGTLAAGFRPAQSIAVIATSDSGVVRPGTLSSAGVLDVNVGSSPNFSGINVIIPLDLTV